MPASSSVAQVGGTPGKLIFGLGPEADGVLRSPIAGQLGMYTSWYNGPGDLAWMSGWANDLVPEVYDSGKAMHLVTFTDNNEGNVQTRYGPACGRTYPLTDGYLDDMRKLANIYKGSSTSPPLFVTLFTEVQTYGCVDNGWKPNAEVANYYMALKDRYMETMAIFHATAPNAKVSLGWGGWQSRFDDPAKGAGRSMFGYFADVMKTSDFQSFQAMQSDSNVEDIQSMASTLSQYGPVMVAHFKADNASQRTWDSDMKVIFTDAYVAQMTAKKVFAFSFMDDVNPSANLDLARDAINRFGVMPKR